MNQRMLKADHNKMSKQKRFQHCPSKGEAMFECVTMTAESCLSKVTLVRILVKDF